MKELQELLGGGFSFENAKRILELVYGERFSAFSRSEPEPDPSGLLEYYRAGQIDTADLAGKRVEVLFIRILGNQALRRNRVGLRKAVDSFFNAADEVSGLLAFYYREGEESWRLSYAWKRAVRDEKGKIKTEATDTGRCSYLLGRGENVRTPALRLEMLSVAGSARTGVARAGRARVGRAQAEIRLSDIEEAFSVEAVSERFFAEYKGFYERIVTELAAPSNRALFGLPSRGAFDQHAAEAKPLRDFAKKLLGRLVFLKFLEKKGWLGASAFAAADGRRDFLLDLFKTYRRDFYTEALVPLFFETLNRPRKDDLFRLTGSKIPYLNGGLFENDYGIEEVNKRIKLSGGLFEELLDFMDRYNFTVDEHEEGEEEIGVDPEMLGRIFERLIEDNEKDMNGTIYTPTAVVEFMCRNSLQLYLCRKLGCEREDETGVAIKRLLTHHESSGLSRLQLGRLEQAARDIKVLDPAVGSGAFPLGMLKELISLRESLAEARGEASEREAWKREIIRSSLYGVDIDAGAVDIARLRLFLALVVDCREPEPLPNLDFKIMQGDSLAEGWEEIPIVFDPAEYRKNLGRKTGELFDEGELARLDKKGQKTFMEILSESEEDVLQVLDAYFDPDQDPAEKHQHRALVQALELASVRDTISEEVRARRNELEKAEHAYRMDPKKSKEKSRDKAHGVLAKTESYIRDFKVLAEGSLREKPYFLWHYYFHDAFEAGGFDIIIGNPPYRANQENENDQAKNKEYPLIDARIRETFVAKSNAQKTKCYDLFARFLRLAMDFSLKASRQTIIALITNYSYIVKDSYDGFRRDLKANFGKAIIINLGGDVRSNSKLSGPKNSIFGIQAGVAICIIDKKQKENTPFDLFYAETHEEAERFEKIDFLSGDNTKPIELQRIVPDADENWIGLSSTDFIKLLPICTKEENAERGAVFYKYSPGIVTARDEWVYDFSKKFLLKKAHFLINEYNNNGFVMSIKWSASLISSKRKKQHIEFDNTLVRKVFLHPYVTSHYYSEKALSDRLTSNHFMQYGNKLDKDNKLIGSHYGKRLEYALIATNRLPNFATFTADPAVWLAQFLYQDGHRLDNITDWSLALFRESYKMPGITKEDIFHYVYAVLHNPAYRAKYALDLKRDYPRIPLYADFKTWADWGRRLMDIHIDFEEQPEAVGIALFPGSGSTRKTHKAEYGKGEGGVRSYTGEIIFSDGSRMSGIPPRAFDYRLGNKSAIEWVLDQYSERHWPSDADIAAGRAKPLREDEKVLRDKFNTYRFADYKDYVVSLIKKLVTISLETLDIQEEMAKNENHGLDLRKVYEKAGTFEDQAEGESEVADGSRRKET